MSRGLQTDYFLTSCTVQGRYMALLIGLTAGQECRPDSICATWPPNPKSHLICSSALVKLGAVLNHPTGNKHDVALLLDFKLIAGDHSTAVIGFHSKKKTNSCSNLADQRMLAYLHVVLLLLLMCCCFFKYPHDACNFSFCTPVEGINHSTLY